MKIAVNGTDTIVLTEEKDEELLDVKPEIYMNTKNSLGFGTIKILYYKKLSL